MTQRDKDLAHENTNLEQDEEDTQAQSVADEARYRGVAAHDLEDSEKPSNPLDPADTPDLVDHMNQMDTDGGIDMSAYDGEESMDDADGEHSSRGGQIVVIARDELGIDRRVHVETIGGRVLHERTRRDASRAVGMELGDRQIRSRAWIARAIRTT